MPCLTFVPGGMGGSETYARALIAGLDARDEVDLTVITSAVGAASLGARSEHVMTHISGGASVGARLVAIARGAVADKITRGLMKDADVVHYPFTVPVPIAPKGVPWVTTLHDVQHRDMPEVFSAADRRYRAIAYDAAARRATRVITVSDFCRKRIVTTLGILADRIDVARNGVDRGRFYPSDTRRELFVLYPATAWPHKNHARLITAMEMVRRTRPDLRLVLTGGRRQELGPLPSWVEHRGSVPDSEVAGLYRSAATLAFPSLYEGFGLPSLEAMASGCPVAAAASGSLPEVCGDAAVLFDPMDVDAMATAILDAMDRSGELVAAGFAQVAKFSWVACADAHLRSYRLAVKGV